MNWLWHASVIWVWWISGCGQCGAKGEGPYLRTVHKLEISCKFRGALAR